MDVGLQFAIELGRVSRKWRARLDERLKHTGLNQARWMVLIHLSHGGVSQRELAERISVEGPSLVRVLDRLEHQGLVERRACGNDRRIKQLYLTTAAQPALTEITRISDKLRHELLAEFSEAEVAIAWRLLKGIGDKLES